MKERPRLSSPSPRLMRPNCVRQAASTTRSACTSAAMMLAAEDQQSLELALSSLEDEDRVIIWMRFFDALTLPEIKRALHLDSLPPERLSRIIAALKSALARPEGRLA